MELKKFIDKYEGNPLCDAGSFVSEEYKQFQKDLYSIVKKIAKNNNAKVVKKSFGHYFESFFIEKDNKYCYLYHGKYGQRTLFRHFDGSFYIRKCKDSNDFIGETNITIEIEQIEIFINMLLN